MIVLGIDPGSIVTGWALLKKEGKKVHYISSGVLRFNKDAQFLNRLTEIKIKTHELIDELSPSEIALESLIFVKSPTALIKLAQTRGIILSSMVEKYEGKIFEYSPNLVKSSAVGHGHADKESVQKVLDMLLGKRDYATHDESDAVAVALCHILNKGRVEKTKSRSKKSHHGNSLASSLAHKIG
ncbi:MAG: crossover junction endodeoxyribonuclease RuvC [Halobacteriovoraceae bacterium]|nr:crossover junction endodeoxyribonuclease RuvC [Halobacteriovoraceae bacterium]